MAREDVFTKIRIGSAKKIGMFSNHGEMVLGKSKVDAAARFGRILLGSMMDELVNLGIFAIQGSTKNRASTATVRQGRPRYRRWMIRPT